MSDPDDSTHASNERADATRGRRGAGDGGTGRRRRKQHGLFYKVATRTITGLFGLFLIGVVALAVVYARTDIPQPGQDANKQVAIVYYDDGKTEMGRIGAVNRQNVKLGQVPENVQFAFLSAEDRDFYDNKGISPTGIVRAAWADARGGSQQGGSTITQQYVKNYFLTQDRTVSRKVKEIMISVKIDRKYSKQQILTDYLNTIYYGRNAYGIQAASQAYFGVDAAKLSTSQGVFLASVINAPAFYDPAGGTSNVNRGRARMQYVLSGMVKKGWLTQAEANAQRYPTFKTPKPANSRTGSDGFLLAAVESELGRKLKLSGQDIGRGGLRITTTIHKSDQAAAVQAVKNNVANPAATGQNAVHAGLVAMKPDGSVVAMYGGADFQKSQYNAATIATPPGGSSFKVFALTAAQRQGISLSSRISGANYLRLPGETKPITNDRGESFGRITLKTALANSVNTAFVRLNVKMGSGKTLAAAKELGIPATDPGMNTPTANDTLGVADVHVIDMAGAYNTINAGGKRSSPHLVEKVTSEEGGFSYTAKPERKQVVSKDVAANVANAMTGPIRYPSGSAHKTLGDFDRPAGGKTGTTDNFRSAWFTGFTPGQLTTSVGMYAGNGDTTTSLRKATGNADFYGGKVPTQIWRDFMTLALKGQPVTELPKANDSGGTDVGPETSAPSTTQAPSSTSSSSTTSTPSTSTSTSTTSSPSSTPTSRSTAPSTPAPSTPAPSAPSASTTRVPQTTAPAGPPTAAGPPTPGVTQQGGG